MSGGRNKRRASNTTEHTMAKVLDELIAYEDFRTTILPKLQKMMADGTSADEMYTAFESYAAARAISVALTEPDSTKALAGIKEILDRSKGKAKERVEHSHKLEKLPDEQLDAVLASEADDLADLLKRTDSH